MILLPTSKIEILLLVKLQFLLQFTSSPFKFLFNLANYTNIYLK